MSNQSRANNVMRDLELTTAGALITIDRSLRSDDPIGALVVASALAAIFVQHHFDRSTADALDGQMRRALKQLAPESQLNVEPTGAPR